MKNKKFKISFFYLNIKVELCNYLLLVIYPPKVFRA